MIVWYAVLAGIMMHMYLSKIEIKGDIVYDQTFYGGGGGRCGRWGGGNTERC